MIRRVRFLLRFGLLVLAITIGAVVLQANRMLERHGEGRSVEGTHDAALVLGAGIDADGRIGYSARRRVRAGVDLYKAGKVGLIIVSDGMEAPGSPRGAHRMAEFAQSLGVPKDVVVLESAARSTFENILNTQPIVAERGLTRVVLVTDDYHLTRSQMLAHFLKFELTGSVATDSGRGGAAFTTWPNYLREALAWWYNLYKATAWTVLGYAGWSAEDRESFVD